MSCTGRTDPDEPSENNHYWGEHKKYRVEDWILDARSGNTRKGYWAWGETHLALEKPEGPEEEAGNDL